MHGWHRPLLLGGVDGGCLLVHLAQLAEACGADRLHIQLIPPHQRSRRVKRDCAAPRRYDVQQQHHQSDKVAQDDLGYLLEGVILQCTKSGTNFEKRVENMRRSLRKGVLI